MPAITFRMRLTLILQLCLGLISLVWIFSYPFMGRWYELQSELLLIESVMGSLEGLKRISPEKAVSLEKQAESKKKLYNLLKQEEREWISKEADLRKYELQKPILTKMNDALFYIISTPITGLSWILLSITLPIMLLLRRAKAFQYVVLIPILSILLAWQNQYESISYYSSSDLQLFPKETTLQAQFPHLSLKEAWENFLIQYWAGENASPNKAIREEQLIRGDFNFSKARLNYLMDPQANINFKKSGYFLGLVVILSILFTWSVYREKKFLLLNHSTHIRSG